MSFCRRAACFSAHRVLFATRRSATAFVPIETPVFEEVEIRLTKSGGTPRSVYFVQSTGIPRPGPKPDLAAVPF